MDSNQLKLLRKISAPVGTVSGTELLDSIKYPIHDSNINP
jgi:hypothetical protein